MIRRSRMNPVNALKIRIFMDRQHLKFGEDYFIDPDGVRLIRKYVTLKIGEYFLNLFADSYNKETKEFELPFKFKHPPIKKFDLYFSDDEIFLKSFKNFPDSCDEISIWNPINILSLDGIGNFNSLILYGSTDKKDRKI